ncbi:helix-turn-helix transcriptional regulator [Streptomyces sp. 1222.5]|uniref:helix-turn-helix transcriptional regulator n=1 Tax=Streptomyces sp. 1222.5 TaxID=1881026 RepID=UPI003EBF8747
MVTLTGGDSLFVGRERELGVLSRRARAARQGTAGMVLVQGVAGVGKSALVQHWLATESTCPGMVLKAVCDAEEADLAFGVIGQLLRRVPRTVMERFELLRDLPPGASAVLVGGELLALLDALQDADSVLAIVEDVHWADAISLRTLSFLLRRVQADRFLGVFTARPPVPEAIGKLAAERGADVRLMGLDESGVAELGRRITGAPVKVATARKLQELTGGNPLYLKALLTDTPPSFLQGRTDLALPVSTTLASAVRAQLRALSAHSQAVVEAAAVLKSSMPLHTVARLAGVPDPADCVRQAVSIGLLRWWPNVPSCPVMIAHDLQRQAVLETLSPTRRRELHAGAASLVDMAASWRHRVSAADGPNADLARELEQAASESFAAGAIDRAGTLLLWASDLAPSREDHERLLLTAVVRLLWGATRVGRVRDLLPAVRRCSPSNLRTIATATVALFCGQLGEAESQFTDVFDATSDDPGKKWITTMAGIGLMFAKMFNAEDGENLLRNSRNILALDNIESSLIHMAGTGLLYGRMYADGPKAGLAELDRFLEVSAGQLAQSGHSWLLRLRGTMRMLSGMMTAGRNDFTELMHSGSRLPDQAAEEYTHFYLALANYWTGAWDEAALHADLALTTTLTDQPLYSSADMQSIASWVHAGRGDARAAQELLCTAQQSALPWNQCVVQISWAIEAQARSDWAAMLQSVMRLTREPPRRRGGSWEVVWKPLQVEALIRNKHMSQAAAALDELHELADTTPALRPGTAWLAGQYAEACGDPGTAEEAYEKGLALPCTPDDQALHRAFLEHAYGRLAAATERSQKRAQHWLKQAHRRYTAMKATAFLQRLEADLDRTNPNPRLRTASPLAALTDREHDVAMLASQGLTNNDIAEELYISRRTVEYHLSHVYMKLNLIGRRQLRDFIVEATTA